MAKLYCLLLVKLITICLSQEVLDTNKKYAFKLSGGWWTSRKDYKVRLGSNAKSFLLHLSIKPKAFQDKSKEEYDRSQVYYEIIMLLCKHSPSKQYFVSDYLNTKDCFVDKVGYQNNLRNRMLQLQAS